MTNMVGSQEAVDDSALDALIPPPRSRWVRLLIGALVVGLTGFGAALWGQGYLYPKPECCGSGSGGTTLALTPDGRAVSVTAYFLNSAGRDLRVDRAEVDLPGAQVLDVALVDPMNTTFPVTAGRPLPATIAGTTSAQVLITYVPTTCTDPVGDWGTVRLRLRVTGEWWPSVGRTYRLPGPVVRADDSVVVFGPEGYSGAAGRPLSTACELLGRTGR